MGWTFLRFTKSSYIVVLHNCELKTVDLNQSDFQLISHYTSSRYTTLSCNNVGSGSTVDFIWIGSRNDQRASYKRKLVNHVFVQELQLQLLGLNLQIQGWEMCFHFPLKNSPTPKFYPFHSECIKYAYLLQPLVGCNTSTTEQCWNPKSTFLSKPHWI